MIDKQELLAPYLARIEELESQLDEQRDMFLRYSQQFDDELRWNSCRTIEEKDADRLRRLNRGDSLSAMMNNSSAAKKMFFKRTGYKPPKGDFDKFIKNKSALTQMILDGKSYNEIIRQRGAHFRTLKKLKAELIASGELAA